MEQHFDGPEVDSDMRRTKMKNPVTLSPRKQLDPEYRPSLQVEWPIGLSFQVAFYLLPGPATHVDDMKRHITTGVHALDWRSIDGRVGGAQNCVAAHQCSKRG